MAFGVTGLLRVDVFHQLHKFSPLSLPSESFHGSIPKVHFLWIVFHQEDRCKAHYSVYSDSMLPSWLLLTLRKLNVCSNISLLHFWSLFFVRPNMPFFLILRICLGVPFVKFFVKLILTATRYHCDKLFVFSCRISSPIFAVLIFLWEHS